jgi:hypothetical protein
VLLRGVGSIEPASLGALAWSCGVCNIPARRLFRALSEDKAGVATEPLALARTLWACAVLDLRSPAATLFEQYTTSLAKRGPGVHIDTDGSGDGGGDGGVVPATSCKLSAHDEANVVADLAWAAARLQVRGMNLPHIASLTETFSEWVSRQTVDESGRVSDEVACVVASMVRMFFRAIHT